MKVRAYLIVFNPSFAAREAITNFFDSIMQQVTHWIYCLPGSIFFTSTLSANELAAKLETTFGTKSGAFYIVTEVPTDSQGRLPQAVWNLVNLPEEANPNDERFLMVRPPKQ
jgi:hypothetical protein